MDAHACIHSHPHACPSDGQPWYQAARERRRTTYRISSVRQVNNGCTRDVAGEWWKHLPRHAAPARLCVHNTALLLVASNALSTGQECAFWHLPLRSWRLAEDMVRACTSKCGLFHTLVTQTIEATTAVATRPDSRNTCNRGPEWTWFTPLSERGGCCQQCLATKLMVVCDRLGDIANRGIGACNTVCRQRHAAQCVGSGMPHCLLGASAHACNAKAGA
jgi:hypothetical protein